MTSDASTQPRADDVAPVEAAPTVHAGEATGATTGEATGEAPARPPVRPSTRPPRRGSRPARRARRRAGAGSHGPPADDAEDDGPPRARRSGRCWGPLVAALTVLLLLLLGAVGYLWFSRPTASSVRTADYVAVLTQGRQDVVDLTSFDYQTIDQDLAQVRKVSVGDLQKDSVALLEKGRQQFTDQQVVVNTEVVSAAVTQAGDGTGRLMLVIQSTQSTKASTTPKVSRYRIQADLQKVGDRWLLSGITGR